MNSLLASPSFASWREGATLDTATLLTPTEGKTPIVVVSVAHLMHGPMTRMEMQVARGF